MAFCPNCGNKLDGDPAFCPSCGTRLKAARSQKTDYSDDLKKAAETLKDLTDTPDTTDHYDPRDISENKLMGILCYLSILWLIPFFAAKDSPFVRFHLNQGLLVLIVGIASSILHFIPVVGWVVSVAAFALAVIGIVYVCQGKVQELPLIGKYKLLS
ncbi:MAG: zinc ribbon domain-containing protein [Lachnospiraceae bacterium]|nr:zinc ribbon domain-containing protein [Lachnospiraceae bacterium]MBQ6196943.1 zinc ribbon domain-containing protein [Lachnospiraceae bacterium]